MKKNENEGSAKARTPSPPEALAWLKESGQTPNLSVTWRSTEESGSAERHLKLLKMLFEPADSAILPPHG